MKKADTLTKYLIGSNNAYLVNPAYNGSTSMLSGEWGVGKTFYWRESIEKELSKKLRENKKACVYVSLYGKDNLEAIKSEILYKSYNSFSEDNNEIKQKTVSVFGIGFQVLSSISILGAKLEPGIAFDSYFRATEAKKLIEGQSYLSDGGVVCLDDFERKSKNIDLNDLFGFISQLSIEMKCKVIIILNSEVFEGKEKNIFNTVKEKTINKFFNFDPSIDELFEVIFDNKNYQALKNHKRAIIETIKESKELNARIYIQLLDNCLEWVLKEKDESALRALILCTINFVKNHFIFDSFELQGGHTAYKVIEPFMEYAELGIYLKNKMPEEKIGSDEIIHRIRSVISRQRDEGGNRSPGYYEIQHKILMENKEIIKSFYHYKYILRLDDGVDDELFKKVNDFVKSGILI